MTRTLLLAFVVAVALAASVACGGDGGDGPDTVPSPSTSPTVASSVTPSPTPAEAKPFVVVANSTGSYLSLVDVGTGQVASRLQVGPAPHRIAISGEIGYVTTATRLAFVQLWSGETFASLPFQSPVGPPTEGEYREGGMGVAVSPDGQHVYAGVYTKQGSFLEVFHATNGYERSVPIGGRPLEVLVSPDGGTVYSIDHDAFTLTAIDTTTWEARTTEVAPLGKGEFDKPHYGAIAGNELLLPYQGRVLLAYNMETGATREIRLTANTHQHGIAVTPDGATALIVGSGPAGDATGGPSLTVLSLADGSERIIPLEKPHELVAISPDGRTAYLAGGYLLEGGWDGITVVDLETGGASEIFVLDRPLGIVVLGPRPSGG